MSINRKQAIDDFKRIEPACGVYALHCREAGKVWVELSRNLPASQTGLMFSLRAKGHINHALQAEFNARGEAAFAFEVVETLDSEMPAVAVPDELKRRKAHWREQFAQSGLTTASI